MSTDDRPMWKGLGLDLEAHDALHGVLGPLHEQIGAKQPDRPAGMKVFDFVMSEVHDGEAPQAGAHVAADRGRAGMRPARRTGREAVAWQSISSSP